MRVTQANKAQSSSAKRSSRAGSAGGEFTLPSEKASAKKPDFSAPAAVSTIDVIVALQAVDEPGEERRQAVENGVRILDLLDNIKVSMLSGEISSGDLERLKRTVAQQRGQTDDPNLANILDEIDLRAKVEIAKLKRSAA